MDTPNQIANIVYKLLDGTITHEEQQTLNDWRTASFGREILLQEIINETRFAETLQYYHPEQWKESNEKIKLKISTVLEKDSEKRITRRVHFLQVRWVRYAAAVIIIFGAGAYLWYNNSSTKKLVTKTHAPSPLKNDIQPGNNKAILTLADGRTILLDSAANGRLAVQEGSNVLKQDGQIIYDAGQNTATSVIYNTMSTPRGGQYQLTLSDGTRVWLNAASSITYPTSFIEKERTVIISGEVYLEVAKKEKQPFIVKVNDVEIQVLGTHFNINSYKDEPAIATTLLEGKVNVKRGSNKKILLPGQQANIRGEKIYISTVNTDEVVAWKNGYFNFINADLPTVMMQLERWYDIDVVFAGKPTNRKFEGKLSRDLKLSEVLEAMTLMQIQYEIRGRTLTIR